MPGTLLSALPEETRRELSICGITTDAQLQRSVPSMVWKDLQEARRFFPNEPYSLTLEQLEHLCGGQETLTTETVKKAPEKQTEYLQAKKKRRVFGRSKSDASLPAASRHSLRSAITHRQPIIAILGAVAALMVPVFFLALIASSYILLYTEYRPIGDSVYLYMLFPLIFLVPHLLFVRLATCSICHMPLYAYRPYPHHRTAHHLPLLGVAFPTALCAIFRWKFRCPACGTAQKLYGKFHCSKKHR